MFARACVFVLMCVRGACEFFLQNYNIFTGLCKCTKIPVVISSLNHLYSLKFQFHVIVYFEFQPPQRIVFHKLHNYLINKVPL